jgi:hypothetical protein
VKRVDVGSYAEWKSHSDHRPLLVEIADHAIPRVTSPVEGMVNAKLNNARG